MNGSPLWRHLWPGSTSIRVDANLDEDKFGKKVTSVEHRAGWDATFSVPKSVSLTALVGGDERVREAYRDSVRMALSELEKYTQVRIDNVHAPETTGKFIAATFEYDTARPVDGYAAPQLHTHAVIFNVTERDNGQTRALQPHELFASQHYATSVYRFELATRLKGLGYELERGKHGSRRSTAIRKNICRQIARAVSRSKITSARWV
jgi:conjugative relaxase-like TrwC/TraI family protein